MRGCGGDKESGRGGVGGREITLMSMRSLKQYERGMKVERGISKYALGVCLEFIVSSSVM